MVTWGVLKCDKDEVVERIDFLLPQLPKPDLFDDVPHIGVGCLYTTNTE